MSNTKDNTDTWNLASILAAHYGPIPSSFSSLVRGLGQDTCKNNDIISTHNLAAMLRFLNGASMQSPFYFYIKTFKSDILRADYKNIKQFVPEFRASELAAFLTLLFLYRRSRKLVEDNSEWKIISEYSKQNSEIGAFTGYQLKLIEPEIGLLVGGLRHLTWASLMAKNLKDYQEYRRHLKKQGLLADYKYENRVFGCSTAVITAHLMILMGYTRELALSFANGMMLDELPDKQQYPGEYSVVLTEIWIDSLIKRQMAPVENDQYTSFAPDEEAMNTLIASTEPARSNISLYHWLDKCKTDLTAESAPELFTNSEKSSDIDHKKSVGCSSEELMEELEQLS